MSDNHPPDSTPSPAIHVRLLTASRSGAIAVVELAGPTAQLQAVLGRQFTARHAPKPEPKSSEVPADSTTPTIHPRPILGWWRAADGTELDEVLAIWRSAEIVEIHAHGGRGVIRGIFDSLGQTPRPAATGWPAEPEFSPNLRGTYERALAGAKTAKTARLLLHQMDVVPHWLERWRQAVTLADESTLAALFAEMRAGWRCAELIEHAPPTVALAGAQNAGKSTLFNALIGGDRALVSPHAGTTRDIIEATIAVAGFPVRLLDTAGVAISDTGKIAMADDRLERRGQVQTLRALLDADLVVHLIDLTWATAVPNISVQTPPLETPQPPVIVVGNKVDLVSGASPAGLDLAISADSGHGIDDLLELLAKQLRIPVGDFIVPVPLGDLRRHLAAGMGNDGTFAGGAPSLHPWAAELAAVVW